MKTLKFRTWNNDSQTFNFYDLKHNNIQFPKNCEIMQYIGTSDKKEIEIYENDIVEIKTYDNLFFTGVVEFKDSSFMINCDIVKLYAWMDYEITIIGNKYENRDLYNVIFK